MYLLIKGGKEGDSLEEIVKRSYKIIRVYIFNLHKRVNRIKNGVHLKVETSLCLFSRGNPLEQLAIWLGDTPRKAALP